MTALVLFFYLLTPNACLLTYAEPTQNFNITAPKVLPPIQAPLKTLTVGEKLTYDVFWFTFRVGVGTIEVKEIIQIHGRQAYHLVAIAKTTDFLAMIYPVEDEVHSYVDTEGFYSLEFKKKLKEGGYRADEKIVYDYAAKKGHYESFHNKSTKEVDIGDKPLLDILSSFYWFRLQPMEVGKSIHADVNGEEKNWDLELKMLSRQTRKARGKKHYDTVLVEPITRLKGVLRDRGQALVYFSVEADRLPVCISLKTSFGPIIGILRN
jgi:hypothetical protein